MNQKQKRIVKIFIPLIAASFIPWMLYGFEIFTKTKVLIEKTDELFGHTIKEWEDKFVWGLDLSVLIAGLLILTAAALIFFNKNKRKD